MEIDPVPTITAGVETIKCDCGWEKTFIMPEEVNIMIADILNHLRWHGLTVPNFISTTH